MPDRAPGLELRSAVPGPSRRGLLLGGAWAAVSVAVAGCDLRVGAGSPPTPSGSGPAGTTGPSASPSTADANADVAAAGVVLAQEQAMLDLLDGALERFPRLTRTFAGTRAGHVRHVALLRNARPADHPSAPALPAGRPPAT